MELINYYKKLLKFLSKLLKINDNLPYLVVGKNNKILYSEAKIPFEYETIYPKECFINANYPQEKCDKYYELFKNKYSKNDINLILNDINFEPLNVFNL